MQLPCNSQWLPQEIEKQAFRILVKALTGDALSQGEPHEALQLVRPPRGSRLSSQGSRG